MGALFTVRKTAKRKHTNMVKRDKAFIVNAAFRAHLDVAMPALMQAFKDLIDINERFVATSNLDAEEQHASQTFWQGIQQLQNTWIEAISRTRQTRAARRGWDVSNSGREPNCTNAHSNSADTAEQQNVTIPSHVTLTSTTFQSIEPHESNVD